MPSVRLPAPEDTRRGVLGQLALLAETVDALPDKAFALPTRLGTWRVAELVGHLVAVVESVPHALDRPVPDDPPRTVLDYLASMRSVAPLVADRAVELARGVRPKQQRARLHAAVEETVDAIRGASLTRVVGVRLGAIHLGGFLMTRCVEGVVHGLDLRAAAGVPAEADPTALAVTVKVLTALLVHTAPGGAVEVRVPGHVAAQCVDGPRHTRGTPPNVVEAEPEAFVEIASGRLSWADAVATGRVRASGERSDLSAYVPLIG